MIGWATPPKNEAWRDKAACAGQDTAIWFDESREATAVAICATCPSMQQCRDWAQTNREPAGVWGGTTPVDRRRWVRNERKRRAHQGRPVERTKPTVRGNCGTRAGYAAHYYHSEFPCAPCRDANRVAHLAYARKAVAS